MAALLASLPGEGNILQLQLLCLEDSGRNLGFRPPGSNAGYIFRCCSPSQG
jgi:hypothetical protein